MKIPALTLEIDPDLIYTLVDGNIESLQGARAQDSVGLQGVVQNVHENMVYHLSDNQVMAMIIASPDRGILLGRGLFASLLSSLPSQLRPAGYRSSIELIMGRSSFILWCKFARRIAFNWGINISL